MRSWVNFLRNHADWFFVLLTVVLLLSISLIVVLFAGPKPSYTADSQEKSSNTYNIAPALYQIVPPDPAYPAPAKEQRAFYMTYTDGGMQYSIDKLTKNVDKNPAFGLDTYQLTLYNAANKVIDIMNAANISFGCIAKNNPYASQSVKAQDLHFAAYERKQVTLSVDPNCMYLGTADSKYFWRLY
jgi:hypothetical protein